MIQTAPIASITPHFRQVTPATIWSFVRVQTRDGAVGWGEATINGRAREIGVDVRRQAAALAARAGRAALMVDCHWRFTPAVAEAVLQELGRIGVAWFECPIPEIPANIQAVRRLRGLANAAGMQLAGMEEASLVEGFLPWADD